MKFTKQSFEKLRNSIFQSKLIIIMILIGLAGAAYLATEVPSVAAFSCNQGNDVTSTTASCNGITDSATCRSSYVVFGEQTWACDWESYSPNNCDLFAFDCQTGNWCDPGESCSFEVPPCTPDCSEKSCGDDDECGSPCECGVTEALVGSMLCDDNGEVTGPVNQHYLYIRETDCDGKNTVVIGVTCDADISDVTVETDELSGKAYIHGLDVACIDDTFDLYIPKINNNGVYICPGAESLEDVVPGCTNEYVYSEGYCVDGNNNCEIVVQDVSDYYKVSGVTGSGGGNGPEENGPAPIPEFSTIGLIFAIVLAGIGITLIVKKKK